MSTEQKGTLSRRKEGNRQKWRLVWEFGGKPYSKDGDSVFRALDRTIQDLDEGQLASSLPMDVYFTIDKKMVLQSVRPASSAFVEAAQAAIAAQEERAAADRDAAIRKRAAETGKVFALPDPTYKLSNTQAHFHNPYNFIPTPEGTPKAKNGLAHRAPVGHHAYHADRFTGRLTVTLEIVTPLIIGDTARAVADRDEPKHLIVPQLDQGGEPVIPITSFKGVLRSAYEAITLSRMGVLDKHEEALGRRMAAGEGLAVIPARISDDGSRLELFMGGSAPGSEADFVAKRPRWDAKREKWEVPSGEMYAAWLPMYRPGRGENRTGPILQNQRPNIQGGRNADPRHGALVSCSMLKVKHGPFSYWRVEEIVEGDDLGALSPRPRGSLHETDKHFYTNDPPLKAVGYVCRTGQSFGRKHDERVFFVPQGKRPHSIDIGGTEFQRLARDWKRLVADYREQAKAARRGRGGAPDDAYLGTDPGKTAFSRHVYEDDATDLRPGTLAYALFEPSGKLKGLYPVMIARELGAFAPEAAVPDNVRPATSIDQLSPADRVFGWVSPKRGTKGAPTMTRGQLRIRSIDYEDNPDHPPISDFSALNGGRGLPLAILSTPKPSQARFYLSSDRAGTPLKDGMQPAEAFYVGDPKKKSLRGRKVYPHHRHTVDLTGYWDGPAAVANPGARVGGYYREFVRPNRVRDDQNRSITGWINPGVRFTAEIDVVNLSAAELGALAWLFGRTGDDPATAPVLRMGYGKPLGFGSVRATLTAVSLADGEAMAGDYDSLLSRTPKGRRIDTIEDLDAAAGPVEAFKTDLADLFGKTSDLFGSLPVVQAWTVAATGFGDGLPVHYPRARGERETPGAVPPHEEGKNFEWFVANTSPDKVTKERPPYHALPPLWAPRGLPMLVRKT